MLTFKRLAVPILAAIVVAAALTGVPHAQTAQGPIAQGPIAQGPIAAPATSDDSAPGLAREQFLSGLEAFHADDMEKAIAFWELSAAGGHLGAQWNLVRIFSGEAGLTPDPRRRLHYLFLAASQHNPDMPPGPRAAIALEALVEVGQAFLKGVPQAELPAQPARARGIFEHAASLYGHPRAQHNLGMIYLSGDGVRADKPRALRWLVLAARKQYAPSQAALGDHFWHNSAEGEAGVLDRRHGLMWLALAGQNTRSESAKAELELRYNKAIAELGEEERQRVEELVAGWHEGSKAAALDVTQ